MNAGTRSLLISEPIPIGLQGRCRVDDRVYVILLMMASQPAGLVSIAANGRSHSMVMKLRHASAFLPQTPHRRTRPCVWLAFA